MAYFQHQDKQMHFDLYAGVLPEDTLFIHDILASNYWWQPAMQLLKSRYRGAHVGGSLALAEWTGSGLSSKAKSEDDLQIEQLAKDYIGLIHQLGLSNVSLVGHGYGGLIALKCLSIDPTLFRKSVLINCEKISDHRDTERLSQLFAKMSTDREYCDSNVADMIYRCDVNNPLMQQIFDDAFYVDKMIWDTTPSILKDLDMHRDLAKIETPVLVMHGEFDKAMRAEVLKQLAKEIPTAEYVEVKGFGHTPQVENPGRFVDIISDYLY